MIPLLLLGLLQDPVQWEAHVGPWINHAKGRVRDGQPGREGNSVLFVDDLEADENELGLEGGVRAILPGGHLLSFSWWRTESDGKATLDEDLAYGGSILTAGTEVESTLEFSRDALGYAWRWPGDFWKVDLGFALERVRFRSEINDEATILRGWFPSPQIALSVEAQPWLVAEFRIGGLHVPFTNGNTEILQPEDLILLVRGRHDRYWVELGYRLYHVHLEEDRDEADEDVVHFGLRGIFLSLGVSF